jgi:pre-rRNA-processing protein TSR4
MPPYDSESSDEGEDYTETNVLLGYATEDATGDAVSHLGGAPVRLHPSSLYFRDTNGAFQAWIDDKTPPSGATAKCKVCNGLLSLLLQLDGNLPQQFPGHDRRLYIWTCRRKTCRRKEGSVRALRGVRIAKGASNRAQTKVEKPKVEQEEKPQPKIGESLFGVTNGSSSAAPANPFSNPFSSNAAGKAPANPFSSTPAPASCDPVVASPPSVKITSEASVDEATATLPDTFASKVRLSSPPAEQAPRPHEPWPAESSFPEGFPRYHLDAEYETLDAESVPEVPQNVRMMDIETEGSGSGGGKEDKEVYESSIDKTFQKFADRLGQNPEQVLRYEFKGKPLLYSDTDAIGKILAAHSENASQSHAKVTTAHSRSGAGLPRCQTCGADRVFEAQLTPHAITELEAHEMSIDGMEWGTILLGVCSKDCKPTDVPEGEVGYVEEWVGVQWEEVNSKR